jgi:hypothetical protein
MRTQQNFVALRYFEFNKMKLSLARSSNNKIRYALRAAVLDPRANHISAG